MPSVSRNSNYYFNFDTLRNDLRKEKEVRAVYLTTIADQTGIHTSQVTRFLNEEGATLGVDLTVTLVKWLGRKVEDYTVVRNPIAKHIDTPEQRQLRVADSFLRRSGLERQEGESAIDAMMRLLSDARNRGLLEAPGE